MKRGSKEFYELMDQFEKDLKIMPIYTGSKPERSQCGSSRMFYENDTINKLFIGYMFGFQTAKSLARIDALNLDE